MTMTLAEAMAIEVLRGDVAAACALADMLVEERRSDPAARALEDASTRDGGRPDGFAVYHWPEFRALAVRLGLRWDLLTVDTVLRIPARGPVVIEQSYRGVDTTRRGAS